MIREKFEYDGVTYEYEAMMVETDFGPENKVVIYKDGEKVSTWQEAASVDTIIDWFKQQLEDYKDMARDYENEEMLQEQRDAERDMEDSDKWLEHDEPDWNDEDRRAYLEERNRRTPPSEY